MEVEREKNRKTKREGKKIDPRKCKEKIYAST